MTDRAATQALIDKIGPVATAQKLAVDAMINGPRAAKRKTNVAKVRDGLQIAMDGLGDERGARMQRTIMQGLHYLADPNEHRQDMLAHWANEIAEAADDLADFIGPEDAGADE